MRRVKTTSLRHLGNTHSYVLTSPPKTINMSAHSELVVADAILENQIVDVWPDYPCLYDVRSTEFKNRDLRENALGEIVEKLRQTSKFCDINTGIYVQYCLLVFASFLNRLWMLY